MRDDPFSRYQNRRTGGNGHELPPLTITIAASLAGKPVPERQWLVPGWIPLREVTLLSGDGGVGKTLLAMQLQIAVSAGAAWLGLPVTPGPSLGFYCEDDEAELHRRLVDLADLMRVDIADLTGMAWRCAIDDSTELVDVNDRGDILPTAYFHQVEQLALSRQDRLLVFDASTNFYGGDEIRRRQVNAFLRLLGQLARSTGAAVLLLAHPSLAGMSSGSGLSGSTHWNNGARSRMYFTHAGGENPDPYERELARRKANYASTGDVLRVRWERGGFVGIDPPSSIDRAALGAKADRVFKSLLVASYGEGSWTSSNAAAPNYAPRVFAKRPDREGLGKPAFEAAMYRLTRGGEVKIEDYGPPSQGRRRLAPR